MESSSESRKDRHSDISCSKIKYESQKIIDKPVPLLLHSKPRKCTRRLRKMQRTFPSSHELSSHECMFSINHHQVRRITQSMNNGDEVFVSPIVRSGNVVVIPSSIMHDSIEDMAKRMSLKETSSTRLTSIKEKRMIKIDKDLDSKNLIISSSNYSASPVSSFSTAVVHCVWESNLPFFEFVSDDHRGETFVANPVEVQTAANKSLDYVYIFHLHKQSGNLSKKSVKLSDATHVVGKMTVSSSLIVSLDRSKFMETEFVLFDTKNGERSTEKDTSSLQTKKLSEILPPRSSLKHNPKHKFGESNSDQFKLLPQTINELESLTNGLSPNFESAAIVIRDYGYKVSKDEVYGGWGLKFLEQAPSQSHKERHKDLNVLVPAGLHGGPVPSSLIDRWKSGRHCDCGGWDVGCPLTVLKNHSVYSKADKEEDSKPFELFIEDGKKSEPNLKVLKMNKGIYVVNFVPVLSALQAFATAVAFIHSHTPDLWPKL